MATDFEKAVRRRTLHVPQDAQPFQQSQGTEEDRARRRSWALNTTTHGTHQYDGAEESNVSRPLVPPKDYLDRKSSSSSLTIPSEPGQRGLTRRNASRGRDRRPKTSSGVSETSKVSRSLSQRAGALPTIMEKKYVEISVALQGRQAAPKVRRWDARTRTTSVWDGLRRDSELFSQRGNCLVHFHEKGQSRRGPSLKVPLDKIYSARFASLFTFFHTEIARNGLDDGLQYGDADRQCELYIPAPDESSRKDSFTWHVTTRNFFAFVLGRPLVGASLGEALIELRERLDVFRPNDPRNHGDLMAYLERIGYLEFAHCRDYAVALLNFAEHFHMHELWVDAFVHCVGMNEALASSSEFQYVSRVTQALITRAYLEMDLHLGRVTRALSNFLEEDFSPAFFGASSAARLHLDRFRTFLHSYYVAKFGYWPPPKGSRFSKSLYKSMYFDFRGLYDFLVDLDSNDTLADQKPAAGGICVLQNVKAFDARHIMIPLPHPHPLLPQETTVLQKTQSQRSLRAFKLGAKQGPVVEVPTLIEALGSATNSNDLAITSAPLVKAYRQFEREYLLQQDEKISITDARKIRWLLIYGTLQMLVSVIRAPKEVRVTETAYPLCCLVTGTPPWMAGLKAINSGHHPSVLPAAPIVVTATERTFDMSVQPDCENGLVEYFSPSTPTSDRRLSSIKLELMPTPTPSPVLSRGQMFRNVSIRSVKSLSRGSFTPRSSRRSSTQTLPIPPPPPPQRSTSNFCEILVHGYGNGLNEAVLDAVPFPKLLPSELSSEVLPEIVVSQKSPPPTSPWKESQQRPSSSCITEASDTTLILQQFSQAPEPSRTPLLVGFDAHRTLPGLNGVSSKTSSIYSVSSHSSPNLSSSRSNSSASRDSNTTTSRRGSSQTLASEGEMNISPIEMSTDILTTLTSKKSIVDLPMVVALEEKLEVYRPSGLPSSSPDDAEEDEEFPVREKQGKRKSIVGVGASVSGGLKSSLRRTRTAAKSVRIIEDGGRRASWRSSVGL